MRNTTPEVQFDYSSLPLPIDLIVDRTHAAQCALAILNHPASLQFTAPAITALDEIVNRGEEGASPSEWRLITVCSSALFEAERRA